MIWNLLTDTMLLGNTVLRWALALAVAVVVASAIGVIRRLARTRLRPRAGTTGNVFDDVLADLLGGISPLLTLVVVGYAGARMLDLEPDLAATIQRLFVLFVIVQVGLWGNAAIGIVLRHYRSREDLDGSRKTTLSALTFMGRLVLFTVLMLLALDNLGIDVTALIAGLGIGALAIGLALQNVLSDLFASLSIVVDKPFEIGDFIVVGDQLGTIEHIGLRTTRMRSLSGEQVVFPNSDIINSRIHNYKRLIERRVVFTLGVTYETASERLREIPGLVQGIIEAQEPVRFDRAHFKSFGAFSLDFEFVYWVLTSDYAHYMDVQHAVNLAVFDAFAERGIDFAYPTQMLHLQRVGADAGGPEGPVTTLHDGGESRGGGPAGDPSLPSEPEDG